MMGQFNIEQLQIKDYIEKLASNSRIKYFYPQTISKNIGMPLELVGIVLRRFIEDGYIDLKYEIKCSTDFNTFTTVDDYKAYLGKEEFCDVCGETQEITYSNIYPVYYFNEEYKEFYKKKVKKEID